MAIEYLTVQYFQKLLKNILFVTSYRIKNSTKRVCKIFELTL
jgi:hypothetical protein